jgi:hypothetical protein
MLLWSIEFLIVTALYLNSLFQLMLRNLKTENLQEISVIAYE